MEYVIVVGHDIRSKIKTIKNIDIWRKKHGKV